MPSGLFYLNTLDRSISYRRGVWIVLLLPCFIEFSVFDANSVDRDQTPRSAASDTVCQCPFYGTLGLNGLRENVLECMHRNYLI